MGLRNFFSNGEGPQATGEAEIVRACGVVVDHGSYGELCNKAAGHDGLHMGTFMSEGQMQAVRHGMLGGAESIAAPMHRGSDLVLKDVFPGHVVLGEPDGENSLTEIPPATQLVLTQLRAMNDRFSRFESNVHQLNLVAGELVNKVLTPLKGELEQLRYNLGDKANSTVSMLERLVGHVDKQLDIALKLTGATTGGAKQYRDEHGCHGDVPSITELTESGVKASPEGSALAATAENLLAQLEQVRAQNMRLTRENAQLKASGYGE
jgi:hypothetical protein